MPPARLKVLVVEDHASVRLGIGRCLGTRADASETAALAEADAALAAQRWDLLPGLGLGDYSKPTNRR